LGANRQVFVKAFVTIQQGFKGAFDGPLAGCPRHNFSSDAAGVAREKRSGKDTRPVKGKLDLGAVELGKLNDGS
jgi:hypothetical protein